VIYLLVVADKGRVEVSVVIPTRNRAESLTQQLEAFAAQSFSGSWEVIVADNGSADRTPKVVEEFATRIPTRLVTAGNGRGSGFVRNRGVEAALGDYILFVDDDDRITPGWLEAMARAADRADIVRGRDRYIHCGPDGVETVVHVMESLTSPFGFLPSVSCGNSGIRKDLFSRIGGFNERYRRLQDTDLFWRAQLASGPAAFVADAVVDCRLRSGMRAVWKQTYDDSTFVPMLYRNYRDDGMPRSRAWDACLGWARIARYGPRWLCSYEGREELAREAAWRIGMIVGTVRHGACFL
jgi:glycosyltransferase involved in cell wall biosynthesis